MNVLIVVMICATIAGSLCLVFEEPELAGVAFGVLGTYAIKNGVSSAKSS